jgi:hypothetical protein
MSSEIELIRTQLRLEAAHAAEVAGALAADTASPHLRSAGVDYLAQVLAAFEERDQRLADLVRARPASPQTRALAESLRLEGAGRETLKRLESAVAGASGAAWDEFGRYFAKAWSARRSALDQQLTQALSIGDWRLVAGLDTDSILGERSAYRGLAADLASAGGSP